MTMTAWLLEWPASDNQPTRYWNPDTGWMMDPNKGIWFAREVDAASYKKSSRIHGIVKPTEHVFGLQIPAENSAADQSGSAATDAALSATDEPNIREPKSHD